MKHIGYKPIRIAVLLVMAAVLLVSGVAAASEFAPWSTQTVDSGGKVGQYSSVALDASGNPAISYYDQTYGDLKYASWEGTAWVITTVDASKRSSGGWSYWGWGNSWDHDAAYQKWYHGTEKVGEHSSLAFDSSGRPRISYYDESKGDLKYAAWDGSQWIITTVDGNNYRKGTQRGCNWDGDQGKYQTRSVNVGEYSSLAFDSSDNPRISYYDKTNGDLKYASWDGTKWVITTVDASKKENPQKSSFWGWGWGNDHDSDYSRYYHGTGKVGEYSSLALDSSGNPRISYYDETNKDLKYASWDGTRWVITTVDSAGSVGAYSSLGLDAMDSPRISYYDATRGNLKFAAWNRASTTWETETVDSSKKVGTFTSLVLDTLGNPSISYYDQKNKDLKYTAGTGHAPVIIPTVTGIAPVNGSVVGGTEVTITGTRFTGTTAVTFDGTAATEFTVVSDTSITVIAPAHAAGSVDVVVTTPRGSATGTFTYETEVIPTPTVTGITPETGPVSGGTEVTITGTKFTGTTAVTFDGTAATEFTVVSDTSITATTPAHAAGSVDIVVTTPGGSATGTYTYEVTVIPAPTVTGIDPSSGLAGADLAGVSITGTNFVSGTTPTVRLEKSGEDNIEATGVTVNSPTQITCNFQLTPYKSTVPGKWDVVVQNADGQSGSLRAAFTITNPPPTVTSIEPSSGQNGTVIDVIRVTGTNFGFGANPKIWLAKAGEANIPASDTQIFGTTELKFRLNIPASAPAGQWDLWIESQDGQTGAYLGMFTITYQKPSERSWVWSTDGWEGWTTTSAWTPTTSTDTIYGPVVEGGHGVYGTAVSTERRAGSTQSTVTKTFTAAPGEQWSTMTFNGLLSASEYPAGRSLAITVNGQDVYSATAGSDSSINGQEFTITRTFEPANTVTVAITGKQGTRLAVGSYTLQFNSLTLS
ncbi:IPT/TIG domain-containing protein [Methanoregula sp.]|uniref:IPT/TIG domain-containing protein n=1 Tax=Methanoregula sp. TaxID=2052170 RepID=UPI000CBCC650|nr:IPT/TIG domain-containing protein [Methanoregula sp.]PKG33493.1 MAG: hypothetical protein CW742_02635 [Methanoregula sp.]